MHVAVIGGGGTIGSTVAYGLAVSNPPIDLTLVDVDTDGRSEGERRLRFVL